LGSGTEGHRVPKTEIRDEGIDRSIETINVITITSQVFHQ
jgi:hypothetical protein